MATSRDPADNASLNKLNAELASVRDTLAAANRLDEEAVVRDERARSDAAGENKKLQQQVAEQGKATRDQVRTQVDRATAAAGKSAERTTSESPEIKRTAAGRRVEAEADRRVKALTEAARSVEIRSKLGPMLPALPAPEPNQKLIDAADKVRASVQNAAKATGEREKTEQRLLNEFAGAPKAANGPLHPEGLRGALGGGAGGGGTRPPTAVAGGGPGGPEGGARQLGLFNDQLYRQALLADLASQRMRKHGALTTEFIEAAAKGQVTVRELGYQVTATIGKFAGWTAAATAVYGAAAALKQVGAGAIAADSGVRLVQRIISTGLDTDRLRTQFRDLSREFNVPTDQVAQTFYQSAKTFPNDQEAAGKAARAALFAQTVGELDLGQSTQALTAIVNGFKLSQEDLLPVMDAVNQVTNKMGGNVGQLVRGVAKAGGQFKASGGDFRQLIAILSAGARLTGATAEEVATAVGRSASVVRTPAGAARARAAGLDPTQDPLSLLRQAQDLAKGQSPERVQEIARSIIPAGGQFARILVPLIQNPDVLNKALKNASPGEAAGSSSRELRRVLQQIDQEIKKIGTDLNEMGANLAQSGLLAPLGVMVKTLHEALRLVNDIIGVFNSTVPDPLRPILASALELYGVVRLLRRFDVGRDAKSSFGQFFAQSPQRRQQLQVEQGLDAEKRFLVDARERTGQQAALAVHQAREGQRRVNEAERTGDPDLIERRRASLLRLSERAEDLAAEEAGLRTAINQNDERRIAFLRGVKGGSEPYAAAVSAGIPAAAPPVALGRPTTVAPTNLKGSGGGAAGVLSHIDEVERQTANLNRLQAATLVANESAVVFSDRLSRFGLAGKAIGKTAVGGARTARAVASGLRGAGGALRGAAVAVGSALGPLDVALIGGLVLAEELSKSAEKAQRTTEQIKQARAKGNPRTLAAAGREVADQGGLGQFVKGVNAQIDAVNLQVSQSHDELLNLNQVRARVAGGLKDATGAGQQIDVLRRAVGQVDKGYEANNGDKQAQQAAAAYRLSLQARIRDLQAAGNELSKALHSITDPNALQTFTEDTVARIGLRGHASGGDLARLAGVVRKARDQLADGTASPAQALQNIKAAQDAVVQAAQDELQRSLAVAKTPGQKSAAYKTFRSTIGQGLGLTQLKRTRDLRIKQAADEQKQLDALQGSASFSAGLFPLVGGLSFAPRVAPPNFRNLKQALTLNKKRTRQLRQQIKATTALLDQLQADADKQQADQEREDVLGLFQSKLGLATSQFAAGGASDEQLQQRAVSDAQKYAAKVKSVTGLKTTDDKLKYNEALRAIFDAKTSLNKFVTDQAQSLFESQVGLATSKFAASGASDEALLRRAISDANQIAGNLRQTHPDDQAGYNNALRGVFDAKKALADYLEQEAEAVIRANGEIAKAKTNDPVKQNRIDTNVAKQLEGLADTRSERLQRHADVLNLQRDGKNLRLESKAGDIDFNLQMGKITSDVAADQYRALAKQVKNNKELKRKYLLAAKNLRDQDSGDWDLNLGNIKIPTRYEARRQVIGGGPGGAGSSSVVQHNNVHFTITGVDADLVVKKVTSQLTTVLKTSARAAARASGRR